MNRKSITATLQSICMGKFIQAEVSDDTSVNYIHVFDRPYDSQKIGITEDGYWCLVNESKVWPLKTVDHAHVFYLLLYTPINEIIELIKGGLKNSQLPENMVFTFPFDELVLGAIQSSWIDLALKWVEQGFPLNEEMLLYLCNNDKQSKSWLNHKKKRLYGLFNV